MLVMIIIFLDKWDTIIIFIEKLNLQNTMLVA